MNSHSRHRRTMVSGTLLAGVLATCQPLRALEWPQALAPGSKGSTITWPVLRLVDGSVLQPADWGGMAAVVVFWETWCPYCKRHNERMERLHQATSGSPLRVLGATTETDTAKVTAYLRSSQLHFPTALVDAGFRSQFSARTIIPLTCLVSAVGRLLQVIPGEMTQDDILSLSTQVAGGQAIGDPVPSGEPTIPANRW